MNGQKSDKRPGAGSDLDCEPRGNRGQARGPGLQATVPNSLAGSVAHPAEDRASCGQLVIPRGQELPEQDDGHPKLTECYLNSAGPVAW